MPLPCPFLLPPLPPLLHSVAFRTSEGTLADTQAVKEFSKSRLKQQALQERQAKAFRDRRRRPRPGAVERKPGDGPAMDFVYGGGDDDIEKKLKDDPLFLIRKEIAVMKKLE